MKKNVIKSILILFLLGMSLEVYSQDIPAFDYTEIIIKQKVTKKNKSPLVEIYVNSTTSNELDKDKVNEFENTVDLLKYMNAHHWILVDRIAIQPGNVSPVWISYIFKKKK